MTTFHEHLDACEQCRNHPFDLCPVGHTLLMSSIIQFKSGREATQVLSLALRKLRLSNEPLDATARALADVLQEQYDRDLVAYRKGRVDV